MFFAFRSKRGFAGNSATFIVVKLERLDTKGVKLNALQNNNLSFFLTLLVAGSWLMMSTGSRNFWSKKNLTDLEIGRSAQMHFCIFGHLEKTGGGSYQ